jgi:hypothetical protein
MAVADKAQAALGLTAGTRLTEVVVGRMLVYIPREIPVKRALELEFEQVLAAFRRQPDERAITADDTIADIERHKDERFRAFNPGVG